MSRTRQCSAHPVDYLVFLLGRWDSALPAAVLLALPVLPSRRTLEAALAARALVCLELRIMYSFL